MTRSQVATESPEAVAARYLAEACHELRTPVAVMSLVSELGARVEQLDPQRVAAMMDAMRRQVVLLRSLIDRYLEHGVLVEGGWSDVATDVDVAAEVGAALDSLSPLVPAEQIRRDLAAVRILGDAGRIRSIVVNLVLNAVRYGPDHDVVDVQVKSEGEQVVLTVADRGIGIPEDERDRILEPFRRGTNATEHAVAGVGLGLPVVAAHVTALDGRVVIADRAGGGTVVTVRLPASRTHSGGG